MLTSGFNGAFRAFPCDECADSYLARVAEHLLHRQNAADDAVRRAA